MSERFAQLIIQSSGFQSSLLHGNPGLLFLLQGGADVEREGVRLSLSEEDFLYLKPGEPFSVQLGPDAILGILKLSQGYFSDYLPLGGRGVDCFSQTMDEPARGQLLARLRKIFSYYSQQNSEASALFFAKVLELLYQLRISCSTSKQQDTEKLSERILRYLYEHYREAITLADLSEMTFYSTSYLSRFIKRKFGKSFVPLLTELRLNQAAIEVAETQTPILRIASDCGFPNVSAFNHTFRDAFGMTPTEYRKQAIEACAQHPGGGDAEQEPDPRIVEFLEQKQWKELTGKEIIRRVADDPAQGEIITKIANRIINVGYAKELLNAEMQMHILLLKKELGFSYVRFWDIWSDELMLYDGNEEGRYNFSRLDSIMDFLHENDLYPFLELGFKPVMITRAADDNVFFERRYVRFRSAADYAHFIGKMLEHYISRYDEEYVERWFLEMWYYHYLRSVSNYLRYFIPACRAAKAVSPKIRVGGMGTLREPGPDFEVFLREWSWNDCRPDFISLYLFPYDNGFILLDGSKEEAQAGPRPYRGDDYTRRFLEKAREIMAQTGFSDIPLYLTEWNFNISNRQCVNDSVFMGARVVKDVIDMTDKVELAGYWFGSDLASEYYDSSTMLKGGCGLLTKDGIPKPSFYALQFLNMLYDQRLSLDKNSIVTTNQRGSFRIVCHNYCHPNEYFYAQLGHPATDLEEQDRFFIGEELQLEFLIPGVANGTYYIKKRTVDAFRGSIQDELRKMGGEATLNRKDIEYLKRICVPHISIETTEVTDGKLRLRTRLAPHAIESLHIFLSK